MEKPEPENARNVILDKARNARERLFKRIEGGSRDFPQMRADLESYVNMITAADELADYEKITQQ